MGKQIIKCAKGVDLYMEWSSVAEAPVAIGSRDEIRESLLDVHRGSYVPTEAEVDERLRRADATGTSAWPPFGYRWEDADGAIYMQRGWLPRARFLEFAQRMLADKPIDDLIEPFKADSIDVPCDCRNLSCEECESKAE